MNKINVLVKLTLLFFGILLFTGGAFSQGKLNTEAITADWNLFQEVKGVKL